MKLEFLYAPTTDLQASLALYRDALGCEEVWREGHTTVALTLPGTDVQLMLAANDPTAPVGPLFVVDSVQDFHTARPAVLRVVAEPSGIPGGFMATYQDPAGLPSTSWISPPTRRPTDPPAPPPPPRLGIPSGQRSERPVMARSMGRP